MKVTDDQRAAAQSAKIEALQKQLAKAKKLAHKAQKGTLTYFFLQGYSYKTTLTEPIHDDDKDSFESEEHDAEDEIGFHTSVRSIYIPLSYFSTA